MKQKLLFLFFCMIFVAKGVFAQDKPHFSIADTGRFLLSTSKISELFPASFLRPVPAGWQVQNWGFMCRQELKLEKFTKFSFRLRLGSLQQCNYLEGKKGWQSY